MANSMSARSRACSAAAVLPIVLAAPACGHDPAVSPAPGTAGAHTATALSAVGRTATNTYAVTVTIETADPNSSTYQKDSAAILAGFELVAPGGMQPASN